MDSSVEDGIRIGKRVRPPRCCYTARVAAPKRIGGIVIVLAIAVAAFAGWQAYAFTAAQQEMTAKLDAVRSAYAAIAEKDAYPLEKDLAATPDVKLLIGNARGAIQDAAAAGGVTAKAKGIMAVQVALRRIVQAASADSPLRASPWFAALAKEVGPEGGIRGLLDGYNVTAKWWNQQVKTQAGSLTASLTTTGSREVPLLRFDGVEEYETVIRL